MLAGLLLGGVEYQASLGFGGGGVLGSVLAGLRPDWGVGGGECQLQGLRGTEQRHCWQAAGAGYGWVCGYAAHSLCTLDVNLH